VTGVILAAGRGERLSPLTNVCPKSLLCVDGEPIMLCQLKAMSEAGVNDVLVVVGHLKEQIIAAFQDGSSLGIKIRYVEQQEITGIVRALQEIEPYIETPFLLLLGDIVCDFRSLSSFLDKWRSHSGASVIAVKRDQEAEELARNYRVELNPGGRVVHAQGEHLRYANRGCCGYGIYLFDLAIFDAIRCTPRTAIHNEYELSEAIEVLIRWGYPVFGEEIPGRILNVTVPEDLRL